MKGGLNVAFFFKRCEPRGNRANLRLPQPRFAGHNVSRDGLIVPAAVNHLAGKRCSSVLNFTFFLRRQHCRTCAVAQIRNYPGKGQAESMNADSRSNSVTFRAGRLLAWDKSENGNGTTTTSRFTNFSRLRLLRVSANLS